nr:HAD-IA family hydrolase [Planctomycetota bacterium]
VYAEVAARYGLERQAEDLERAFPDAFRAVLSRWPVPYGADDEDARRFWAEVVGATFGEALSYEIVVELYDTFATAARWRVLPGAREALALVRERGLPAAVVSNFDCRLAPLLRDLALGPFAQIVVSATVGAAKPDPAALIAACRACGVAPEATVHVGDSEREDGGCCRRAGVRWLPVDAAQGIPLAALAAILDAR